MLSVTTKVKKVNSGTALEEMINQGLVRRRNCVQKQKELFKVISVGIVLDRTTKLKLNLVLIAKQVRVNSRIVKNIKTVSNRVSKVRNLLLAEVIKDSVDSGDRELTTFLT